MTSLFGDLNVMMFQGEQKSTNFEVLSHLGGCLNFQDSERRADDHATKSLDKMQERTKWVKIMHFYTVCFVHYVIRSTGVSASSNGIM